MLQLYIYIIMRLQLADLKYFVLIFLIANNENTEPASYLKNHKYLLSEKHIYVCANFRVDLSNSVGV